ncbi:hypothetical protein [Natronococcus occultus]|uniref:Uncharacterized protein n=1 Tax=Natronococcus occultus SP4 TaxID=694430 RepID=L0JZ64_9EURY|nr:hypothetical protein [Natronococcus occultus]AGB37600.1 hypothetical protein Natoc_1803 [Natronococcus occultus SP4]
MLEHIFGFEERKMPLPVVLSTIGLIAMFAIGIVYRLVSVLVL